MRTKLTDIICTMAEYNCCSDSNDELGIEIDEVPDTAIIIDDQEATIKEMLIINQQKNKLNERAPYRMENVKPFEQFINEINQTTYTTTQSYFGCLDDSDDEEE